MRDLSCSRVQPSRKNLAIHARKSPEGRNGTQMQEPLLFCRRSNREQGGAGLAREPLTCPAPGGPGASEVPRQHWVAGESGESGEWARGRGANEHHGSSDELGKSPIALVRQKQTKLGEGTAAPRL